MSITLSLFVFLCRIIRARAAQDKKKSGVPAPRFAQGKNKWLQKK